jgi:glycosyltransferase involved in cell wall biosynthesis
MSNHPTVSVIIPLYNKAAYIGAAIDSVFAQTFNWWELLVVDNGSEDGGEAVVTCYEDPRVKLLSFSTRTGGPGAPRNFGLDHATGDWILFLDADDAIASDHLETLLATARENPSIPIIAGCWQEYFAAKPDDLILAKPTGYDGEAGPVPEISIAYAPWAVHAALVKREILVTPYRWVEDLDPFLSEDTAFWFRLLTQYPYVYSQNHGALYRKCQDSRNQYQYPARWLQGMQAITASNVSFLEQEKLPLTAKHCESLMRLYSSIYLLAKTQQDQPTAAVALTLAQHWLTECANHQGCTTLSLKARQIVGLQRFLPLTYWQQSLKGFTGQTSQ